MRTTTIVSVTAGALCSVASAQSFVNGNFETNDLTGWTVVNTTGGLGAPGSVQPIDIDVGGPLAVSPAAAFMVGRASTSSPPEAGIEMTQSLNLTSGTAYTFAWDCAAYRLAAVNNSSGGTFTLIVNGVEQGAPVILTDISSATPKSGHGNVTYTAPTTGSYVVGLRITRPFLVPGDLTSYVDNVSVSGGGPPPCYANCDASTSPPILNVNDFTCFLNTFAAGFSSANCDASTNPPVLNVNDFTCFLNLFAVGCS